MALDLGLFPVLEELMVRVGKQTRTNNLNVIW